MPLKKKLNSGPMALIKVVKTSQPTFGPWILYFKNTQYQFSVSKELT